jgi:hypothetical protein
MLAILLLIPSLAAIAQTVLLFPGRGAQRGKTEQFAIRALKSA